MSSPYISADDRIDVIGRLTTRLKDDKGTLREQAVAGAQQRPEPSFVEAKNFPDNKEIDDKEKDDKDQGEKEVGEKEAGEKDTKDDKEGKEEDVKEEKDVKDEKEDKDKEEKEDKEGKEGKEGKDGKEKEHDKEEGEKELITEALDGFLDAPSPAQPAHPVM